jgi:CRP-like cAMP-binding protein
MTFSTAVDNAVEMNIRRTPPARNVCLAALSPPALTLLKPHMSDVYLREGTPLWEPGSQSDDIFFPITGFVSIVLPMRSDDAVEIASAGRETAAGAMFEPNESELLTRGVVQIAGAFIRMPAADIQMAAQRSDEVRRLLDFCRDWMLAQAQQSAACNAIHSADARLCRWLAQCFERSEADTIYSTHESIAAMLGIRRTTVTLVAQKLMADGVIRYRRGNITLLDQARLRASACDCCTALSTMRWPASRLNGHGQPARPLA